MESIPGLTLSLFLVLTGSIVFFISAWISGFNLYREVNSQLAWIGTLSIGVVLFGFSPASFILITRLRSPSDAQLTEPLLSFETVEELASLQVMGPFLAMCVGLGLMVGGAIVVELRSQLFVLLRKATGLQFRFHVYVNTWDSFLKSLKRWNKVTVKFPTGTVSGQVGSISVREEPRELELMQPGHRLLVNAKEITGISAPASSFRRHYESHEHFDQAFYTSLIAAGLLIHSLGTLATPKVFPQNVDNLALLYAAFGISEWVLGVVFLLWAAHLGGEEGCGRLTSFAVRPFMPKLILSLLLGASIIGLLVAEQTWFFLSFVVISLGAWRLLVWKTRRKRDEFLNLIDEVNKQTPDSDTLKQGQSTIESPQRFLEFICVEADLNKPISARPEEFENLVQRYSRTTPEIATIIKDATKKGAMFEGDHYLLCSSLLIYLQRKIR